MSDQASLLEAHTSRSFQGTLDTTSPEATEDEASLNRCSDLQRMRQLLLSSRPAQAGYWNRVLNVETGKYPASRTFFHT